MKQKKTKQSQDVHFFLDEPQDLKVGAVVVSIYRDRSALGSIRLRSGTIVGIIIGFADVELAKRTVHDYYQHDTPFSVTLRIMPRVLVAMTRDGSISVGRWYFRRFVRVADNRLETAMNILDGPDATLDNGLAPYWVVLG